MLSTRKVYSIRPRNIRKFTPEYFGSNEKRPKQQLSGKRASRSPGVQGSGCAKQGLWKARGLENTRCKWKTRGQSRKYGIRFFFRQNMNFPHYNPQHLGLKCVKRFVRKKTIQEPTCGALLLILLGRLFYSLALNILCGKKKTF